MKNDNISNIKKFIAKCNVLGIKAKIASKDNCMYLCSVQVNFSRFTVPQGIDVIDILAFTKCEKLCEVYIPKSLKEIKPYAFFNCINLKKKVIYDDTGTDVYFWLQDFLKNYEEKFLIGAGAFENCFGHSSIILKSVGNEDVWNDNFVKALKPYPFYKEGSKNVLAKILSIENENTIHISLLNYSMLLYDYQALEESSENQDFYYKPYFYEFFTALSIDNGKFMDRHLGEWLEAYFENEADSSENDYIFDGEVFFSASPFQYSSKKLVIRDKKAPTEVINIIKRVYELKKAIHIDISNKDTVLNPIMSRIVNGAKAEIVKVYNVGQAGCNYIYLNNGKRVMFDVGYSYQKKDYEVNQIHNNRFIFSHCKPDIIILSHWDLDHILGVAFSNQNMFKVPWIAPTMGNIEPSEYSVSASRLAKYLSWKGILYIIDDCLNEKDIFIIDTFQLWKGTGKENGAPLKRVGKNIEVQGVKIHGLNKANNSGLIIKLVTDDTDMLLPGDCEYTMLPKSIFSHKIRYSIIVVPHHCSNMILYRCKRKSKIKGKKDNAIISVGSNTYKPKHPWGVHINFLKRLKYKIYKTNEDGLEGYMIRVDLRKNEIY